MRTAGNVIPKPLQPIQKNKPAAFKEIRKNFLLYILLAPAFIVTLIFVYVPMPFLAVSFFDYSPLRRNILNNPFVGLANFESIIKLPELYNAFFNTVKLSFVNLMVPFFAALIFALLLNEIRNNFFKRLIQSVSFVPYFLATISAIGIAMTLLSSDGPINNLMVSITGNDSSRILFMSKIGLFIPIAVLINLWRILGWNTIIFLAAITSIDEILYEAAYIDGANRFKQIRYITLPGMMPTAVMLLILTIGSLIQDNFDLVYGLQNPFMDYEVIQTVLYKYGIMQGNFSTAAAFSLTQGIIGFLLTMTANKLSKTVSGIGLF